MKRYIAAAVVVFCLFLASCCFAEEKTYIVVYKDSGKASLKSAGDVPFEVVDEETLKRDLALGLIERYEEDYEVELLDTTPDMRKLKWELDMIEADPARALRCDGKGVRIGIVDSGVEVTHPDLIGCMDKGYDYVLDREAMTDTYGHGTFVAGMIAANDNGAGSIGASPQATLVPIRCFEGKTAKVSTISRAIRGAVDKFSCDVLNMSFGLKNDSDTLRDEIEHALDMGVILVASAGNDGTEAVTYPAGYDGVIGVAAVTKEGARAYFSNHNSSVFIAAPGYQVTSLALGADYEVNSGTSFSAPLVSAAAAILLGQDPSLTRENIMKILKDSAVDAGVTGYDPEFGWGILNIRAATEILMADRPLFVSRLEHDAATSAILYNRTDEVFSGVCVFGCYDGAQMTAYETCPVYLEAGKTATVQSGLSGGTVRCFLRKNLSDVTVLANSSSLVVGMTGETEESVSVPVPVDGETAIYITGKDGVLYLNQVKGRSFSAKIDEEAWKESALSDAVRIKTSVASYRLYDVNGDDTINNKDITLLRRSVAGGYGVSAPDHLSDVNLDGTVNTKDITALRRHVAGGYGI